MNDRTSIDNETLLRLYHSRAEERKELASLAETDPEIRRRLTEWNLQDAALLALYNSVAYEPVPNRHKALITEAAFHKTYGSLQLVLRIAAMITLVTIGAGAGWFVAWQQTPDTGGADLASNALRVYSTYAFEIAHPVEVPASDEAHLESWLSKRLGRPFAPPDLSSNGFRLLGGRVIPDPNGAAAMMMYEDTDGQRVTLYVAPTLGRIETAMRFAQNDAAQGFWWVDDQLGCGLFGNLPRETLRAISLSAYHGINGA